MDGGEQYSGVVEVEGEIPEAPAGILAGKEEEEKAQTENEEKDGNRERTVEDDGAEEEAEENGDEEEKLEREGDDEEKRQTEEENTPEISEKKRKTKGKNGDAEQLLSPRASGSDRPSRERKTVDRYISPQTPRGSSGKPVSIEKGRGMQLKDIPNVAFKLSKRKADENLQLLHTILFGKKAKAQSMKRNIGLFSGFVWVESEQEKHRSKTKEKLEKCIKDKLLDFCDILNIPVNKATTRKEELSARLLEFLESPHATTSKLLAEKDKGKKRSKVSATKNNGSAATDGAVSKKQKLDSDSGKHSSGDDISGSDDDDPDDAEENEHTDEDPETAQVGDPKTSSKKSGKREKTDSNKDSKSSSASKKDSKGKKQSSIKKDSKSNSSSSSKKQKGGGENNKKEAIPSRAELHAEVENILKKVDFNTATLSNILEQLGDVFGLDLMDRKREIKDIISEVIQSMSEEEEEDDDDDDDDDED